MRKDEKNTKLTEYEIDRNKKISKVRYIVEQSFGLYHLHDDGQRARFTTIDKNHIDNWFRQVAFNIQRGFNIFKKLAATAQVRVQMIKWMIEGKIWSLIGKKA